eukprot:GGOE01019580.1.p1 GENE.GGOE01019580.1~~GGOE01019580.1.p1  ORF type:complete len:629 (-),score=188.07 GGOE01019580.1:200-1921(-)
MEEDEDFTSHSDTDGEQDITEAGHSTLTEAMLLRSVGSFSPNGDVEALLQDTNILEQLQKRAALLDSREYGLKALKEQLLAQARSDAEALQAEREALGEHMERQRQRLDQQMEDIEERLRQLHAQIRAADERAQQLAALEEELFQREKQLTHREQQFLSKVQGRAPPSASEPPRSMSDPYTYTYAQETMEVVAISLLIIAGLTTGVICYLLKAILVPFLFSIVLMYIFKPVVDVVSRPYHVFLCGPCSRERSRPGSGCLPRLQHCKCVFIPRWLATLLAVSLCLALLAVLGFTIARSINHLQRLKNKYLHGAVILATQVEVVLRMLNIDLQHGIMPRVTQLLHKWLLHAVNLASECAGQLFIVLVFLAFLLLAPVGLPAPVTEGRPVRKPHSQAWEKINLQVREYIQIKTLISVLVGLTVWIIWQRLGVECSLILALLTGLANYVPTFGPFVATLFPLPLVLLDPDMTVSSKVLAFALPLCLHTFVGNFVEPVILGTRFSLHPVTVLLSVAFWGYLWDVAGLILAVPMMASLQIVLSNVDYPLAQAASCFLAGGVKPASSTPAAPFSVATKSR